MLELLEELRQIFESSISFPSKDLPLDIWERVNDGYIIKPELKEKILNALSKYPNLDLLGLAEAIHIVGSIGTNLYDKDADIDIHIVVDPANVDTPEETQRDVMNWFKNNRDEEDWWVGSHPFEVYLQLDPIQDYYSDTIYDLLSDEWLKPHKTYELDYNPYEVYGNVFDKLQQLTAPADLAIGELRRDVIDYNRLMEAVQNADVAVQAKLQKYLDEKLDELESDIEELAKNKEIWRGVRHNNSIVTSDMSPDDILANIKDLAQSDEWKQGNALFKMLDVYQYMVLTNNLKKLLDGGELTDADVPRIEQFLQEFNTFGN